MNLTLKHSQMYMFFKLVKLRKFNIVSSYDSCCCVSHTKDYNIKRNATEKLKIANEFLSQERKKYEDTFGNIENYEIKFEKIRDDPEDVMEYNRLRAGKGKTIRQYIEEVKTFLCNNEYKNAVNVLEIDMVNDAKPVVPFVYRLLISYNGKIGNIEEAYRLYLRYKKRQGKTDGGIITSLFNACANCKNSILAIEKADAIRKSLNEDKNYVINISNYNSMLKAYGRHGDLKTSLQVVDEVLERKDKVRSDTFGFLLQACASDSNSGLRHALLVWRTMIQSTLKPRIFDFNLMLRCVRDCFLGEAELLQDFIKQIKSNSNKFFKRKVLIRTIENETKRTVIKIPLEKHEVVKYLPSESAEKNIQELHSAEPESDNNILTESELLSQDEAKNKNSTEELKECEGEISNDADLGKMENFNVEAPNLIAVVPTLGSVISFENLRKPHEKLLLLGGVKGFLQVMSEFKVNPDIKTFSLMLEIIPSTSQDEENLMKIMKDYNIKPDNVFFNILIKRRCLRGDTDLAQDALLLMQKENVVPDIITFGVLALRCETLESATELINSLHNFGYRSNTVILNTLLKKALKINDWNFVKLVLATAKEDEAELNPKFIATLTKGIKLEKRKRNEGEYSF